MKWHLAQTSRPWVRTGSTEIREWVGWSLLLDEEELGDEDKPLVYIGTINNESTGQWLVMLLNWIEREYGLDIGENPEQINGKPLEKE